MLVSQFGSGTHTFESTQKIAPLPTVNVMHILVAVRFAAVNDPLITVMPGLRLKLFAVVTCPFKPLRIKLPQPFTTKWKP